MLVFLGKPPGEESILTILLHGMIEVEAGTKKNTTSERTSGSSGPKALNPLVSDKDLEVFREILPSKATERASSPPQSVACRSVALTLPMSLRQPSSANVDYWNRGPIPPPRWGRGSAHNQKHGCFGVLFFEILPCFFWRK